MQFSIQHPKKFFFKESSNLCLPDFIFYVFVKTLFTAKLEKYLLDLADFILQCIVVDGQHSSAQFWDLFKAGLCHIRSGANPKLWKSRIRKRTIKKKKISNFSTISGWAMTGGWGWWIYRPSTPTQLIKPCQTIYQLFSFPQPLLSWPTFDQFIQYLKKKNMYFPLYVSFVCCFVPKKHFGLHTRYSRPISILVYSLRNPHRNFF